MKVSELIDILKTMNPDAVVYEDRHGERRELTDVDVTEDDIDTESECDDADGEPMAGPVVIFGAWN